MTNSFTMSFMQFIGLSGSYIPFSSLIELQSNQHRRVISLQGTEEVAAQLECPEAQPQKGYLDNNLSLYLAIFVLRLIIKITNTIQRGYFHPICGQLGGFQSEYLLINANLHAMDISEGIPSLGVGTVRVQSTRIYKGSFIKTRVSMYISISPFSVLFV